MGNPKSDRRAHGNSAQPSCSSPGTRLTYGLRTQGNDGVGRQPTPIFMPAQASRKGHLHSHQNGVATTD
jgi:hypothetical protein